MADVIIICFLIGSPTTCLLISFSIISTIICILGVMFYWDLVIDHVAVINLILAVGLAVDYSAHIGHTFMLKKGSKDERAIEAIGSIGAAVLNGALSTFLAVVLLSASESYVFRVLFKQFFATVVLGVGHGLILLPVLLSIVGPAPFSSAEEIRTYEKLSIERSSANERKNSNSQVTPAAVVYEGVNEETPNGTVVLTSENETNI